MNRIALSVEQRQLTGRKVGNLRRQGILPANIYGNKVDSLSIQMSLKEFQKVFAEAGETGLIDLMVGGPASAEASARQSEKRPVLVHDVSYDPMLGVPLHVDFHQVNLKEEVDANVPVTVTGESPAEKQGIGTVVQLMNELPVRALPDQLPQEFIVDISNLTEVDQSISVADLDYDREHVKIEVENPEEVLLVKVDELIDVAAEMAEAAASDAAGEAAPAGEAPAAEGEVPVTEGEPTPEASE